MKSHELIYTNTVIPYFLSYVDSREGEERETKVKKRILETWKREE